MNLQMEFHPTRRQPAIRDFSTDEMQSFSETAVI